MSDQELKGRVAIITGSGRSIGRAMALELAAGGAAVVVNVRSNRAEGEAVVKEIQAASDRATRYGILGKTLDVSKAVDRSFTAAANSN